MLERQDDRRPRGQQRRQHSNKRDDVSCVVVLIWLVLALIGTNRTGRGSKGPKNNMGSGEGKGLGVVTHGCIVRCVCRT